MVLLQGLVTPELGYWVRSGEFVFIAILGGSAHALGAFIGAVVFQAIQLVGTSCFRHLETAPRRNPHRRHSRRAHRHHRCPFDQALGQAARTKTLAAADHRKTTDGTRAYRKSVPSFGAIVVADNINFSLHEGERLAVIGANGAGKTTFINIVTGYLRARSGAYFLPEPM